MVAVEQDGDKGWSSISGEGASTYNSSDGSVAAMTQGRVDGRPPSCFTSTEAHNQEIWVIRPRVGGILGSEVAMIESDWMVAAPSDLIAVLDSHHNGTNKNNVTVSLVLLEKHLIHSSLFRLHRLFHLLNPPPPLLHSYRPFPLGILRCEGEASLLSMLFAPTGS